MPYAIQERIIRDVTPVDRTRHLDAAIEERHPPVPRLACPAVDPDDQSLGIGDALLDRRHARPDPAGITDESGNRDRYLRHGYQVRSVIELPDGPSLWTMWRPPMV
jgi:GNAT superfamily N-acetyltransferase